MTLLWKVIWVAILLLTLLRRSVFGACVLEHYTRCEADMDLLCTRKIFFREFYQYLSGCRSEYINLKIKLQSSSEYDIAPEDHDYGDINNNNWKSVALDASNNFLSFMAPSITRFTNLQRLNFSNNQIGELSVQYLYKFNILQELDLSHNVIEVISFLSSTDPLIEEPLGLLNDLTYLNLSYNYIRTIHENVFKHMQNLQRFDLSHNKISFLDSYTFEGLARVNFLDISYNNITNMNFAFLRFSELAELNISNNLLTNLTEYDFRTLTKLEILHLNKNLISNVATNSFNSMKFLNILNLSFNCITHINKDYFTKNQDLSNLDLSYNFIKKIDSCSFKNNVITLLNLESNKLEGALQKNHMEGLGKVTFLNVSSQFVTQIDNFAFFGVTELRYLNISRNLLMIISEYSLKGLEKLLTLDLSYNKLTAVAFDTSDLSQLNWLSLKGNNVSLLSVKLLEDLVSLVYLDVSQNNIVHLETFTFKSLQNLHYLNIVDNPLQGDLELKTFYNLEAVPLLDLSQTKLCNVKNSSLYGMKELYNLNISHSNLSIIEYNAFTDTGKLRVLDVSYNKLFIFFINNTHIPNLSDLILCHNLIYHVDLDTFLNLFNLQRLYFSNNNLREIANGSLSYLNNLRLLDLSFNEELNLHLECIPPLSVLILSGIKKTFDGRLFKNNSFNLNELSLSSIQLSNIQILHLFNIPTLVKLDLGSNEIVFIEKGELYDLNYLETLHLQFNKISTIQHGSFKDLESLAHLNLSHNEISSLGYGVFTGLENLLTLDLSYNQISQINSQRFYYMPHLTFLIIDGNKLYEIQFEELSQTHILSLSIGDNKLDCSSLIDHKKIHGDSPPVLTAIMVNYNEKNVDGITCSEHSNNPPSGHSENTNVSLIQLLHNSQSTNNILDDIKNILSNTKLRFNNTESFSINNNSDLTKQFVHNMSTVSQLLIEKIRQIGINVTTTQDKDVQMEIYNEIKRENFQINRFFKYLINNSTQNDLVVTELVPTFTSLHESSLSEIEKLKEEFKQYLEYERNNITNELKKYFSNSIRTFEYVLLNDSLKLPERAEGNNLPSNTTSKFTEVCIGLIVVVILGFLVIQLYKKYKNVILNLRSISTQEISNNIEMDRET